MEKYHPLFLYESLLNLVGAGVLLLIDRKFKDKLFKGDIFFGYLIWYSTVRFALEFLRLDPSPVNGININQTSMLVVGILAAIVLVLRHTVWSERLAKKEMADKERKLALQEATIVVEDELVIEEFDDLSDEEELDLTEDLEEFEDEVAEIADEDELLEESEIFPDEDEEWVSDNLVEEPEEWLEEHLPDVDTEELPEIDDDYVADEPMMRSGRSLILVEYLV